VVANSADPARQARAAGEMADFRCTGCTHTGAAPWPAQCRPQPPPVGDTDAAVGAHAKAPAAPAEGESALGLLDLEDDAKIYVTSYLGDTELHKLRHVCRVWRGLVDGGAVIRRRELLCFHTKVSYTTDVLGVGKAKASLAALAV
jgi:hypothetical protein